MDAIGQHRQQIVKVLWFQFADTDARLTRVKKLVLAHLPATHCDDLLREYIERGFGIISGQVPPDGWSGQRGTCDQLISVVGKKRPFGTPAPVASWPKRWSERDGTR